MRNKKKTAFKYSTGQEKALPAWVGLHCLMRVKYFFIWIIPNIDRMKTHLDLLEEKTEAEFKITELTLRDGSFIYGNACVLIIDNAPSTGKLYKHTIVNNLNKINVGRPSQRWLCTMDTNKWSVSPNSTFVEGDNANCADLLVKPKVGCLWMNSDDYQQTRKSSKYRIGNYLFIRRPRMPTMVDSFQLKIDWGNKVLSFRKIPTKINRWGSETWVG